MRSRARLGASVASRSSAAVAASHGFNWTFATNARARPGLIPGVSPSARPAGSTPVPCPPPLRSGGAPAALGGPRGRAFGRGGPGAGRAARGLPHAVRVARGGRVDEAERQQQRERHRGELGARELAEQRGQHAAVHAQRAEGHTSELQSLVNLVCRLLLEKLLGIWRLIMRFSFQCFCKFPNIWRICLDMI